MNAIDEQDSEKNSIAADRMFRDIENHDFTLKPGSPALLLGIDQIDITKTGLQKSVGPPGLNEQSPGQK